MEKNVVPLFISAEAVLKPAKGGKSILEATRSDFANLKQFNAAPQSVKKGVELLKADGFTVTIIGKSIIGFRGFRWQFEQAFQIKLQATASGLTTEGAKRFGIIERSGTDRYEELFAGFKLSRAGTKPLGSPFKSTKPPKVGKEGRIKTQLTPGQLPEMLGAGKFYQEYLGMKPRKKVKVAVLDSGYYPHKYFERQNGNVKVLQDPNAAIMHEEKRKREDIVQKMTRLDETLQNLEDYWWAISQDQSDTLLAKTIEDIKKAKQNEMDLLSQGLQGLYEQEEKDLGKKRVAVQKGKEEMELAQKSHNAYFDYDDYNGHGTGIIPQLLAIAPHASVEVYKVFTNIAEQEKWSFNDDSLLFNLELVTKRKDIDIVSNSWGDDGNQLEESSPLSKTDLAILLASPSQVILFAAGNYTLDDKRKPENLREKEAEFPNIISVGGAYREGAGRFGKVIASNGSFGYPFRIFGQDRFVPDICGWVGKNNSDDYNLWIPTFSKEQQEPFEDAWDSSWGGTSSSTAQLAGVCAVIKHFWPGASSEQVREVLKKSADVIVTGTSAQNVKMEGRVGLVNIESAILEAQMFSLKQQISFLREGLGLDKAQ